tara:strand:+ start:821 stop:1684 length:864 start_codon:yes stop_codon:yes gene_type:complete
MLPIGYLGPIGTHTYEALQGFLDLNKQQANPIAFDSVKSLFDALSLSKVSSIFIPSENSIGGEVVSSLDCLLDMDSKYSIQAEFSTKIEQTLMVKDKTISLDQITDIFAHEQSIHQSYNFLHEKCPNVRFHYCSSNAQAAEIVAKDEFEFVDSDKHFLACIGSQSCVELYHLHALQYEINDIASNSTRFLLISSGKTEVSKKDKTSLVFSTKQDKPGSLCEILLELSSKNVNMARIVSRPTKKRLGEYMFFIDIEGHLNNQLISDVLDSIKEKCLWLKVLGSYPRYN